MRGLPLVRQLANRALRQHSTAAVVLATAAIGGAALACSPPARLAFRDLAREYRFAWKRTLMAYRTFASSQKGLVDSLVELGVVQSPEVERVLRAVDRGHFTDSPEFAYLDAPQSIGHGATISAPHMHAYALELLADRLQPGARVLDVGSGTGYLTAACALLAARDGAEGKAVGIEHIPELAAKARRNIAKEPALAQLLADGRIELVVGDGRLGWPAGAPYDAIHVGAAAPHLPQALVEQLAPGGRLVVPVGPEGGMQSLVVLDKDAEGRTRKRSAMSVMYVPLCAKEHQLDLASDSD